MFATASSPPGGVGAVPALVNVPLPLPCRNTVWLAVPRDEIGHAIAVDIGRNERVDRHAEIDGDRRFERPIALGEANLDREARPVVHQVVPAIPVEILK